MDQIALVLPSWQEEVGDYFDHIALLNLTVSTMCYLDHDVLNSSIDRMAGENSLPAVLSMSFKCTSSAQMVRKFISKPILLRTLDTGTSTQLTPTTPQVTGHALLATTRVALITKQCSAQTPATTFISAWDRHHHGGTSGA